VRNVDRIGDAIHRDGIVNDLRSRSVIHGNDVVPGVWSEGLEGHRGSFPVLRRVVEHTPGLAGVVSLPSIVVGITVRVLLTLELQSLGRVGVLRGNVQIELVP